MNAGRAVVVGLLLAGCATDSKRGPDLVQKSSPADNEAVETERRISVLKEPMPPAEEIRRSLEDYRWDLRRLAAQACGRVRDRECLVVLGQRAKQSFVSDGDKAQALDGLVARCGSGGREVLADVAHHLASLVVRRAPPSDVQEPAPAAVQAPLRPKKAHKSTEKAAANAPPPPTDRVLVDAVAGCPSADAVWVLVRAGYGGLEGLLASNRVPTFKDNEDGRPTLKALVTLPPPAEQARVALQEAETKARLEGEAHLAAAREGLAAKDFDKAMTEAQAAELHGVAAADVRAASEAARASEVEMHVKRARALVKKNDPDGATAEVDAAEAIVGGPGSLTELREAISRTPAARRREHLRQAEERRLERERKVEEARVAAEAKKPGAQETPVGVRALRKGPCRHDAIGGRIVARVGPRTYEFIPMNRSCVTNVLAGGSVVYESDGRDSYGYYCGRALLETTRSRFSSSGTFDTCVRPVFRIQDVPLKNGFTKKVRVWTEDSEGPTVPGRRPWPGGG
jgi:hypothetical protein